MNNFERNKENLYKLNECLKTLDEIIKNVIQSFDPMRSVWETYINILKNLMIASTILNNGESLDWDDKEQKKYYIDYDYEKSKVIIKHTYDFIDDDAIIYFTSEEGAKEACKYIGDSQLTWMFTIFKSYLKIMRDNDDEDDNNNI